MKTTLKSIIVCAALFAAGCSFAQDEQASKETPMGRIKTIHAIVTAEVTGIDLTNRELTLKGPQGDEVTITVNDAVKRLDEVKVGDFVRADYLVAIAGEIRKPTAEEAEHPLTILNLAGKTPEGETPAAGAVRSFKVVTTIEALDRRTDSVTVKGPLGRYLTFQAGDPSRLTKVHIGETIVIVYTEAVAVSLEKVEKKSE